MVERERPMVKNNLEVPIFIFKDGVKVNEGANIQETARWLKEHTGDEFYRFGPHERTTLSK